MLKLNLPSNLKILRYTCGIRMLFELSLIAAYNCIYASAAVMHYDLHELHGFLVRILKKLKFAIAFL